jgi:hypothetical protein
MEYSTGKWSAGLAEWIEGDTAFLSVAFTWRLNDAYQRAVFLKAEGYKVRAGGPGTFTQKKFLAEVAELGGDIPEAIQHHNPMATMASRGCPVGCWFCIVPKMEGKEFTLLPEFTPRPVLSDNNLSALPIDYQDYIIQRYIDHDVPLLDANSGFEPRTFDNDTFERWQKINKGPWRFAYDDQGDGPHVEKVLKILVDIPQSRKRVYVLIGNEPVDECLYRINRVIELGGDPHVQPFIKLNALEKRPHVRHDWTEQKLKDMARWCNGWVWRKVPFEEYDRSKKATGIIDPNQRNLIYN